MILFYKNLRELPKELLKLMEFSIMTSISKFHTQKSLAFISISTLEKSSGEGSHLNINNNNNKSLGIKLKNKC